MGRSVYPLCDRAGRDGTSQGEAARYIWPNQSTDGAPRCRGRRLTRVPNGVAGVLVHPRVETGVIVVTDLFPLGGGAIQLHHVGASAKERLARLQKGLEVQGRHVVGHLGLVL